MAHWKGKSVRLLNSFLLKNCFHYLLHFCVSSCQAVDHCSTYAKELKHIFNSFYVRSEKMNSSKASLNCMFTYPLWFGRNICWLPRNIPDSRRVKGLWLVPPPVTAFPRGGSCHGPCWSDLCTSNGTWRAVWKLLCGGFLKATQGRLVCD